MKRLFMQAAHIRDSIMAFGLQRETLKTELLSVLIATSHLIKSQII